MLRVELRLPWRSKQKVSQKKADASLLKSWSQVMAMSWGMEFCTTNTHCHHGDPKPHFGLPWLFWYDFLPDLRLSYGTCLYVLFYSVWYVKKSLAAQEIMFAHVKLQRWILTPAYPDLSIHSTGTWSAWNENFDTRCLWMYIGYLESKERLRIQPAQSFHFSWWVTWCVQ